jgi:hypothetical protein
MPGLGLRIATPDAIRTPIDLRKPILVEDISRRALQAFEERRGNAQTL